MWLPKVLSIKNFAAEIAECRAASRAELIPKLYDVYNETLTRVEERTLLDFHALGLELLDAFDLLKMNAMGLDAIAEAWSGSAKLSLEDFLKIQQTFDEKLLAAEVGYEGLIFSKALWVLDGKNFFPKSYDRIVLAGFVAFCPMEENFLRELAECVRLDFYWDVGEQMLELDGNRAKVFLELYKGDSLYNGRLVDLVPEKNSCKGIEVIDVQTRTAQLRVLCTRLSRMLGEVPNKSVAVILQNTDLLLPLLNSLPFEVERLNIHLNIELRQTHAYTLVLAMLGFYESQMNLLEEGVVEISLLEKIFSNPILSSAFGVKNFLKNFSKTQNSYASVSMLKNFSPLVKKILEIKNHNGFVKYFFSFYEELKFFTKPLKLSTLEVAALAFVEKNFLENEIFIKTSEHSANVAAFIKTELRGLKFPINHKGKSKIYLLGLEQTVCLSYDAVFVLDATEGNVSEGRWRNNFFRKKTNEVKAHVAALESSRAYLVYRLLHNADEIVALYSSTTGELNRYFLQFSYLLPQITKRTVDCPAIVTHKAHALVVEKNAEVMRSLARFNAIKCEQPSELSATALNTYLDCGLKFYFTYLAKIRPAQRMKKLAEHEVFGTLLHEIMASVYEPFANPEGTLLVQKGDIREILGGLDERISHHFRETFERGLPSSFNQKRGYNIVAEEMMRKYLRGMLDADLEYAPFAILAVETLGAGTFFRDHSVSPRLGVRLKAKLDRVDARGGVVRVMDYKTGAVRNKLSGVGSCFDRKARSRNSVALQLLLYAWVFHMNRSNRDELIRPCVVSTRDLFTNKFDSNLYLGVGKKSAAIDDIRPVMGELVENLNATISELFDASVPFLQIENRDTCARCEFKNICQRF